MLDPKGLAPAAFDWRMRVSIGIANLGGRDNYKPAGANPRSADVAPLPGRAPCKLGLNGPANNPVPERNANAMNGHFGPELFEFLLQLRQNNDRAWFQANKHRYEDHLKRPLLRFIEDFGPELEAISPHFVADPRANGGSMFRIYRDVRFSKDKSPYKTQAAAQFRHEFGRSAHAPGFYLHLAPGEVFAGIGLWGPDTATLNKIRLAIVTNPDRWQRVVGAPVFADSFNRQGRSLKRPPRGFDKEHPLVGDLKLKDHIASREFGEEATFGPDFLEVFADACRKASGYMQFLTRALELPY